MSTAPFDDQNHNTDAEEQPIRLPVHLPTLWIGLRSRYRLLGICVMGAMVLGLLGSRILGKRSYEASTVLLYRPPPSTTTLPAGEVDQNDTPSLYTQTDMVKLADNLKEVRRRLALKEPIDTIAESIKVDVPVNSTLMTITVTANKSKKAADIANMSRQVFLEKELSLQHAEAAGRIRDLVARQEKVQTELHDAEQRLKEFTIQNHVVDLDKEAGWYLQQLINTELVYEEAVGQANASRLQQANIDRIAGNLEKKVQAEEAQINDGADRQETVPSDDAIRGRVADLRLKEIEMNRSKTLYDEGIYSRRAYEQAKAAYEQERFMLYKDSPSAALFKDMTLRELDVQLAHISDQEKVSHLREAVQHVHERLDSLPLVQRDYLALEREVTIRAAEREHIDQLLAVARRENESQSFAFSLVSAAVPPPEPLKSNRKLIFLALTMLGSLGSLMLALALELVDRRIRSTQDAACKLGLPVLAGFRHGDLESEQDKNTALTLLNHFLQLGLEPGTRMMVVSASAGEGVTAVTTLLAKSLAVAGKETVLLDANFREAVPLTACADEPGRLVHRWPWVSRLLEHLKPQIFLPSAPDHEATLTTVHDRQSDTGLSDLLAGQEASYTTAGQVESITMLGAGQYRQPELLLSPQLPAVLERASAHGRKLVMLNTTPLQSFPDATFMGRAVPYALLVVAANKLPADAIKKCIAALEANHVRPVGLVLTNIADVYMERRAA